MTTTASRPDRVHPTAQRWDAVVVGGGIAGLSAAWEMTRQGLRPLVVEARGYTGGLIAAMPIGGVPMDIGAEAFVVRGSAITSMVSALGLEVVGPRGGGAQLFLPPRSDEGGPAHPSPRAVDVRREAWTLHPFPADSLLGIPGNPLAPDVVAVLGRAGARRAAEDADMGPEVGAHCTDLASLVATRMGTTVLERLVRPITAGIHTADPEHLDADTVLPGLREALAHCGSLAGAVAHLRAKRPGRAGDQGVDGGMFHLVECLHRAIESAGGRVLTRVGAQTLTPPLASGAMDAPLWNLVLAPTRPGPTPSAEPEPSGAEWSVSTTRVILACSAPAALRLLEGVPGVDTVVDLGRGSPIARTTLLVRADGLDARPVGQGLLVSPDPTAPVQAKALSHLSVKWPWIDQAVRAAHGPHVHALRLSHGRPGQPSPTPTLEAALHDASILTGVELDPRDVLAHSLVHWDGTLPPFTPAHRARADRLAEDVAGHPGLAVTGAWVAGSGIAAVVSHSRLMARRMSGRMSGRNVLKSSPTSPGKGLDELS